MIYLFVIVLMRDVSPLLSTIFELLISEKKYIKELMQKTPLSQLSLTSSLHMSSVIRALLL